MKKIAEEWITKAEEDYLVADRESKARPLVGYAVCFHAQQCIEKYMKAILQEYNIEFERIHDLEVLLQLCKTRIKELENYRDDLVKLSTYAVNTRYPGFDVSEDEADQCAGIMKKLRRVIRDSFGFNK